MIEIRNSFLSIGILPEAGGALSFLKYNNIDILRSCKEDEKEANQTGMFPMLPYASFIQKGHFPYFGITRYVPKNCPFSQYPMHGDVWRKKLQVLDQTENSILLSCSHDKTEGFPFSYKAFIGYKLVENSLEIIQKLQNTSALPMPFGMGVHPFFKRDTDTLVKFDAPKIWFRGEDPILGHPYTAPSNLDFRTEKNIPANGANISFGSWTSSLNITYPSRGLAIEIQADNTFRHLIMYAPKGKDFFCLEPVTNTPDAFNLASLGIIGTGIQSLGPKQSSEGKIIFSVKGLK